MVDGAKPAQAVVDGATPVAGTLSEPPTKRSRHDPELTEPDSDEDSLYGAEDAAAAYDALQATAASAEETPESLSSREVVERRLRHLRELHRLYKVEYWGLLEELNTRHQRFAHRQAADAAQGDPAGPSSSGGEQAGSLREELRSRARPLESGGDTEMADVPVEAAAANDNPFQRASGDSVRGYGSDEDPPSFSDAEAAVIERSGGGEGTAASKRSIQQWREAFRRQLPRLQRLEQAASACTMRELDKLGALACLCGRHNRFLIRSAAVSLGRATDASQVDIDLSSEGDARKVSRHQAHLALQPDGSWRLRNVGRRTILANNRQVDQGQVAMLGHLSLVEVGGVRLLFMVNQAAVKRAAGRTARMRPA